MSTKEKCRWCGLLHSRLQSHQQRCIKRLDGPASQNLDLPKARLAAPKKRAIPQGAESEPANLDILSVLLDSGASDTFFVKLVQTASQSRFELHDKVCPQTVGLYGNKGPPRKLSEEEFDEYWRSDTNFASVRQRLVQAAIEGKAKAFYNGRYSTKAGDISEVIDAFYTNTSFNDNRYLLNVVSDVVNSYTKGSVLIDSYCVASKMHGTTNMTPNKAYVDVHYGKNLRIVWDKGRMATNTWPLDDMTGIPTVFCDEKSYKIIITWPSTRKNHDLYDLTSSKNKFMQLHDKLEGGVAYILRNRDMIVLNQGVLHMTFSIGSTIVHSEQFHDADQFIENVSWCHRYVVENDEFAKFCRWLVECIDAASAETQKLILKALKSVVPTELRDASTSQRRYLLKELGKCILLGSRCHMCGKNCNKSETKQHWQGILGLSDMDLVPANGTTNQHPKKRARKDE